MAENPRKNGNISAIQSFKETIESLVIAFILAFVFRAFVVEAFIIPTGSMADTLRGAHFRLTCPVCSYQYNYGFLPEKYHWAKGYLPPTPINIVPQRLQSGALPICPMCGTKADISYPQRVYNGDRILVLKYIYQFTDPKIWDVVVFKNPTDPSENYIKRLIGRPGEKVEIIDGDVYINDIIQKKPDHVQNTLWIAAFDDDYQPSLPADGRGPRGFGNLPFSPITENSSWKLDQPRHRFEFLGSEQLDSLQFDARHLRKILQCFIAYNGPDVVSQLPVVSDLKLEFVLIPKAESGKVIINLGKYGRVYSARVDFDGTCTIINETTGEMLKSRKFPPLTPQQPIKVSFANLDHSLYLQLGGKCLQYDGPNDATAWGYKNEEKMPLPTVALAGQTGAFTLEHIALYRDNHYVNTQNGYQGLATETNPFALDKDEFFVLGDNSPQSLDSRFWTSPGRGNGHKSYRQGTLPRDYLIGKALFVYWPAGYPIQRRFPLALIPNVGEMRFIH